MNILAIQAFMRRLINRSSVRCAMASMGGVGSTALARHIGSIADKTPREHAYSPALFAGERNLHLGYIYGNPYNAVLSVFRRGYQEMHARAMNAGSDTPATDLAGVDLEAYLERGVDEFRIARQFDNWVSGHGAEQPIILIKYETLGRNIDEVLRFFDVKAPFVVKERKSSWKDQPAHIRAGLEKIHGPLMERIEAMPEIQIVRPAFRTKEVAHG